MIRSICNPFKKLMQHLFNFRKILVNIFIVYFEYIYIYIYIYKI